MVNSKVAAMSQEADITRMHAKWVEKKNEIRCEYEVERQTIQSNFERDVQALEAELQGEIEQTRQILTSERDAIFKQLDMMFQRRLNEKEALIDEKRTLRLDTFQKTLNTNHKAIDERLDKRLQEHEMDYFKIMRPGGSVSFSIQIYS